ncbi:MAG: hypothetical protein LBK13_08795 [Spirochaetales bacterium]|jgi:hypothetical protein|nr:hypothetical protein [Spirochaetales bacterium]
MGRIHVLVFYAGAVWETGRFFFIFELVSALVNPSLNLPVHLLLLWLGSGQMCTALLFFLCGYMPGRFFRLRGITAVFTFMGILPALVIVIGHVLGRGFFSAPEFSVGLAVPLFIMSVDALFLLYLLLPRGEDSKCT